jgi:hypothetical protein
MVHYVEELQEHLEHGHILEAWELVKDYGFNGRLFILTHCIDHISVFERVRKQVLIINKVKALLINESNDENGIFLTIIMNNSLIFQ